MHNQLEQFKSSLMKPNNPIGDCYLLNIQNTNPECLLIDDFKKNYFPINDEFELEIINNHPQLKRRTKSWNAFLDNDLKIIYAHNSEFFSLNNGIICLAEPKDYLTKKLDFNSQKEECEYELQELLGHKEKTSINKTIKYFKINSYEKYNHLESMIKGIKTIQAKFNGTEYYIISYEMKSELKKDISNFYGEQKELEQLIQEINYKGKFDYSCLINASSLKCEIVFNNLFVSGNKESKEIRIKSLGEVLANEVRKIKSMQKSFPPMPPSGPPMPDSHMPGCGGYYKNNPAYPPTRPEEMNTMPKPRVSNIPEGTFFNMAKNNSPQKKAEPKNNFFTDDSIIVSKELVEKFEKDMQKVNEELNMKILIPEEDNNEYFEDKRLKEI
ncbi:MAG: hypothetical protein PHN56_05750 [Candidatus Nanoarchaeia archaeon]|nr:hypothetical protein [Candidatus Nanoarchaeia archaeon]